MEEPMKVHNQARKHLSLPLLFVALITLLHSFGVAQLRISPEEQAKRLKDTLALSDSQTVKVQKIYENMHTAMMETFQSNQGDREAIREAMMTIVSETDEQIEALLTPEQKVKYEEMEKERRNRMLRRNNPPE